VVIALEAVVISCFSIIVLVIHHVDVATKSTGTLHLNSQSRPYFHLQVTGTQHSPVDSFRVPFIELLLVWGFLSLKCSCIILNHFTGIQLATDNSFAVVIASKGQRLLNLLRPCLRISEYELFNPNLLISSWFLARYRQRVVLGQWVSFFSWRGTTLFVDFGAVSSCTCCNWLQFRRVTRRSRQRDPEQFVLSLPALGISVSVLEMRYFMQGLGGYVVHVAL